MLRHIHKPITANDEIGIEIVFHWLNSKGFENYGLLFSRRAFSKSVVNHDISGTVEFKLALIVLLC